MLQIKLLNRFTHFTEAEKVFLPTKFPVFLFKHAVARDVKEPTVRVKFNFVMDFANFKSC